MFKNKFLLFIIIATIVAASLIGFFSVRREKATAVENGVNSVTTTGQKSVSGVMGWFHNFTNYFGDVKSLKDEIEQLKDANTRLEREKRDLEQLKDENKRLSKMLDLKESDISFNLVAARVIAKDPSNWHSKFTIDKGTNDGLSISMPIITVQENLVGQITRIGSNWAEVTTILDPANAVGAMVDRSRNIGIVEGDSKLRYAGRCKMSYLSRDTDIEIEDYIETSGLGGIYPKGIAIGKVEEVSEDSTTMSKYATLKPFADFGKLTEVFVITNEIESSYEEENEEEE